MHFPPAASLLPIANSLARSSLQKAELDGDIARLQNNLKTGQLELSPEKLRTLSIEMRRRLAEGPPDLRQICWRASQSTATASDSRALLLSWRTSRAEGHQSRLPKFSLLFGSGVPEWSKERTGV